MSAMLTRQHIHRRICTLLLASTIATNLQEKAQLYREANRLQFFDTRLCRPILAYYSTQESVLCDIDPADDNPHVYGPPRNRTINGLTDHESVQFMRFSKTQLLIILRCFRLPIRLNIDGYWFTREEVMIFSITKIALGLNNHLLCLLVFGGSRAKWLIAYKWFLTHLYNHYYPTVIGLDGLQREVHNFPYYARKIARKFNQERIFLRNNNFQQHIVPSTTIDELIMNIALIIDCNIKKCSTPGTGPNGDYIGATRQHNFDIIQESVYSGYRRMHCLSDFTAMLPSGLHYVFGPCSGRNNDRWMINQADFNNFLHWIQTNTPQIRQILQNRIYKAYGDGIFVNDICVRSPHRGDALNPLPLDLILQNQGMKVVRMSIEHGYSEVGRNFKIIDNYEELKLQQQNPHARELLIVCYLLSNILICFNGSQVSSRDGFNCNTPSVEEYLELGDEDI